MKHLWAETYRPRVLQEYVFRDDAQRQQVENWIDRKSVV